MPRPNESDFAPYFGRYVAQVKEEDIIEALANQNKFAENFLRSIPAAKWDYAYAPGKWTIKELLQHIIDAERIFAYRALCIARKDKTSFPGFDENNYTPASEAGRRSSEALIEEFLAVRKATDYLFKSFTEAMLQEKGTASNQSITPNALGYITAGHFYHHQAIIQERYL